MNRRDKNKESIMKRPLWKVEQIQSLPLCADDSVQNKASDWKGCNITVVNELDIFHRL